MISDKEKIKELETENEKLRKIIQDLRHRLSRTSGRLNRKMREDYEYVDFGRDR